MSTINTHLGQDFPWVCYKNGQNSFTISFTSSSVAYDISGYTFTVNIRKVGGTTNVLQLTQGSGITNGGVTGILTIALTQAQASTTLPGDYYFYEIIYVVNSLTYPFIEGGLQLSAQGNPGTATTALSITSINLAGTTVAASVTLNAYTYFRGKYTTLVALQAAVPTGNEGDYAFVGSGSTYSYYAWIDTVGWILMSGGSATATTFDYSFDFSLQ